LEGELNRSTYRAERLSRFFALIDKEIKLIEPISDRKLEGTAVAKIYWRIQLDIACLAYQLGHLFHLSPKHVKNSMSGLSENSQLLAWSELV